MGITPNQEKKKNTPCFKNRQILFGHRKCPNSSLTCQAAHALIASPPWAASTNPLIIIIINHIIKEKKIESLSDF